MGLRTWTSVQGTANGTGTYFRTGFEWMVENSDADRIANNRSLVTIRLWISSTTGAGYSWNSNNSTSWKEHDGGNRANITTQFDFRNISGTGPYYCGADWGVFPVGSYFSFYVTHNADGSRSLPVSTYLYGGTSAFQNGSTSTTLTLPAIPRYAAITSFTLNKASGAAGISRLTATWATDTTCDYVAYSLNGGAWTNSGTSGTSGSFNLSGLSPGTTYTLSLAVKRTDSQLYTYSSSAISQTTYDIARITTAPNNNVDVEPPFTITYTNPSGASLQTGIYKTDASTVIAGYRGCTSTAYEYLFSAGERTAFYNQIPTTKTLPLRIYLTTSDGLGNTYYNYVERTFEVFNADPTFTTYTIADTNPTTLALTDSDTKIVSGYSTVAATVSVANKAVGVKSATVSQYKLTVGGVIVDTKNWSTDTDVILTKLAATSATTTVTAVDGRGNDTVVGVNGTLIEYTDIVLSASSATRQSALSEEVDLVMSGTFWDGTFGTVTNSLSASYEYRVVGAGTWTAGTTDITPTVVDDAFSISETIIGDTATGFDIAKQYEIKVTITDELDTVTSTLVIPTSKPWIVLDDDGVGIRTVYDSTIGGALQVGGDTYIDGDTELGGALQVGGDTTIDGNTDITGDTTIDGLLQVNGPLQIPSTADVSLTSTDNPIQIGPTTGVNLVMDGNEIMARNNSAVNNLNLNAEGGDVIVGGTNGANLQVKGVVESTYQNVTQGGEIQLNKPASGTNITANTVIDVSDNYLRFFQNTSPFYGAYLPLTTGGDVNTNKILTEDTLRGNCAVFSKSNSQSINATTRAKIVFNTTNFVDNGCFELQGDGSIKVLKAITRVLVTVNIRMTSGLVYVTSSIDGLGFNATCDVHGALATGSGILQVAQNAYISADAYLSVNGSIEGWDRNWCGINITVLK